MDAQCHCFGILCRANNARLCLPQLDCHTYRGVGQVLVLVPVNKTTINIVYQLPDQLSLTSFYTDMHVHMWVPA